MDTVGLSEVRRPGSSEISSGSYTYYWFGRSDRARLGGLCIGISSRLQPSVVGVTPVDERIVLLRLKHTLDFMSLVAVYAPIDTSELEENEMFYANLASIVYHCPFRETLVVLGDFHAVTGTERVGYELCVGPHGSETRNVNSSFILIFAKLKRLRNGGSWFQRREPRHWSWYSNANGVAKDNDHIHVSTRWRILQNCKVYRSAEFFATDHRLVVATLTIHIRSKKIPRYNSPKFHIEKLRDPTCVQE